MRTGIINTKFHSDVLRADHPTSGPSSKGRNKTSQQQWHWAFFFLVYCSHAALSHLYVVITRWTKTEEATEIKRGRSRLFSVYPIFTAPQAPRMRSYIRCHRGRITRTKRSTASRQIYVYRTASANVVRWNWRAPTGTLKNRVPASKLKF